MYRQGDILIFPAKRLPDNLKPVKRTRRGLVLAEGEVTGHAHCIFERDCELFCQVDLDEMADRFLHVETVALLVHDEHATLTIPAGDYVVRHQREYEPEAPRYVVD
jgi:hypothetical protein